MMNAKRSNLRYETRDARFEIGVPREGLYSAIEQPAIPSQRRVSGHSIF